MRNTAYLKIGFLGIILFLCLTVYNATASNPEDPCDCPEDVTVGGSVRGQLFWDYPVWAWHYDDGQEQKGIFLDHLDKEYTLFYHEDNRVPVNTAIVLFTNKRYYDCGMSFYKSGDTDVWDWREECGLGSWSIGYFCYIKNLYMDGVLQTIGTISNDERYAVGWITPSTPGIKNMTAELDDLNVKDYEVASSAICETSPGNWWYLYYNDPTWTTTPSQPLVVIDGWINDNQGCLDVLEYDPDGTNDEVEISFTVEPETGWCPDEAWLRFSRVGGGGTIEFLLYRRVDEGNDIISSAWEFREFKWHGKAPDPNNTVIEGDYVMPAGVYEVDLILEFGVWKIPGVYNFIKSKQDGTKKTVTITHVNLEVVGVSEANEENPGKKIIWNDDDDNNELTKDWDEDHQVVGEDDLVQITLNHVDYLPETKKIYLKEIGTSGKLRVWTTQDKQANINVNGDGHEFLNSDLPKTLWVEGFQVSDSELDTGLSLYWSCGGKTIKDDVKFTVLESVNLVIHHGQGGPEVPWNLEDTEGAFTVTNLNDSDNNSSADILDGSVSGEEDLMELIIKKPYPDLGGTVTLTQNCGDVKLWENSSKGTEVVLDASNQKEIDVVDLPITYYIESRVASTSTPDIMYTLEYSEDTDRYDQVVATGMWLELTTPYGDPTISPLPDGMGANASNERTYGLAGYGVLEVECIVTITPNDSMIVNALEDDKLRWTIDTINGSTLVWQDSGGNPNNWPSDSTKGEGLSCKAEYTTLPTDWDVFGLKAVFVEMPNTFKNIDLTKDRLTPDGKVSTKWEAFFEKTATNNPGGVDPNWFYYWSLAIPGYDLEYGGANPDWGEVKAMRYWSYASVASKTKITIFDKASDILIVCSYVTPGVTQTTGIAAFADVLCHEQEHVDQISRADALVTMTIGTPWENGWSWNQPHNDNYWSVGADSVPGDFNIDDDSNGSVDDLINTGPGELGLGSSSDDVDLCTIVFQWPDAWGPPPSGPWCLGHPIEHEACSKEPNNDNLYTDRDWGKPGKNHLNNNVHID